MLEIHAVASRLRGDRPLPAVHLADVPDCPARLDVDYPERLDRGLIFVRWLPAFPHLLGGAVLIAVAAHRQQAGTAQ